MLEIVQARFPEFSEQDLAQRFSREDRYVSLTLTVRVEDRSQIDSLYTALTSHEAVLMVL